MALSFFVIYIYIHTVYSFIAYLADIGGLVVVSFLVILAVLALSMVLACLLQFVLACQSAQYTISSHCVQYFL